MTPVLGRWVFFFPQLWCVCVFLFFQSYFFFQTIDPSSCFFLIVLEVGASPFFFLHFFLHFFPFFYTCFFFFFSTKLQEVDGFFFLQFFPHIFHLFYTSKPDDSLVFQAPYAELCLAAGPGAIQCLKKNSSFMALGEAPIFLKGDDTILYPVISGF